MLLWIYYSAQIFLLGANLPGCSPTNTALDPDAAAIESYALDRRLQGRSMDVGTWPLVNTARLASFQESGPGAIY